MNGLDAHARPPEVVRNFYKVFQKKSLNSTLQGQLLDCDKAEQVAGLRIVRTLNVKQLRCVFLDFISAKTIIDEEWFLGAQHINAYEHPNVPGLCIIPSALPPSVQEVLLERLLHRDLSNPQHLTNVHKFYRVTYPPCNDEHHETPSFFTIPPSSDPMFLPKDPIIHKSMSIESFLGRKLRWATLGGQYDWTDKVYPQGQPPAFPRDIAELLKGLFPDVKPEAAIVNLYTPGDTLSMHRDVAEYCDQGLISVSIGCDAVFIICLNKTTSGTGADETQSGRPLAIRLRSGDALYMSGPSRFAWHGVPQIIPNTCPAFLRDWPARETDDSLYEPWRGWMSNKRVNLNVRQMFDHDTNSENP